MLAGEPERIIAIGDLNGAVGVLRTILRGTDVIDENSRWCGGRTHVIQIGDIFDRGGGGACAAFRLLRDLHDQAAAAGGCVTQLLGNHEVMAALGDERWCSPAEYLQFANDEECRAWPGRVERTRRDLISRYPALPAEVVNALLESWKRSRVPGRPGLEFELSPEGPIGRAIRTLPIAIMAREHVFCHAGLLPEWAALGLDGLEQVRRTAWIEPRVRGNIFHHQRGPLWNRVLTLHSEAEMRQPLQESLDHLGAVRMVVGHTPTGHVPDADGAHIATRCDGRLVCIDISLNSEHPGGALLIDDSGGCEWRPDGKRVLWHAE